MDNEIYDTDDAARLFGLSTITLRKWRVIGRGPRFVRLGRSVRYLRADLVAFLASRSFNNTLEADAFGRDGGADFNGR